MKNELRKLALLGVAAALTIPLAVAAQAASGSATDCPGFGQMGRGTGHARRIFDPQTVTTLEGKVVDVQRFEARRHAGVHLTVAVGSDSVDVHLGPDFYVDTQPVKLAKGDSVEVKGSRVTLDGKPAIIAQEVRRGDQVLTLRNASGVPLWRGQGMSR